MKLELPDETGKVIRIEVASQTTRYSRRLYKMCEHHSILVDETLNTLTCRDCGKELNPVQWVSMMAQEWRRVQRLTEEYKKEADRVEERSKVKCRHCGKMTPLIR